MFKWIKVLFVFSSMMLLMSTSCVNAKSPGSPKPGPEFVWVPGKHIIPIRPGYWRYTGQLLPYKIWIDAHYNFSGHWVKGKWKARKVLGRLPKVPVRPPKPGSNFVWVNARTTPAGIVIISHWKYTGKTVIQKQWVPRHIGPAGYWVTGKWVVLHPPRQAVVWILGHYGPKGTWVSGHWR